MGKGARRRRYRVCSDQLLLALAASWWGAAGVPEPLSLSECLLGNFFEFRYAVASRMTRQPFRARAALRTSVATSSICPGGNEKARSRIFSANETRDLRSLWRT